MHSSSVLFVLCVCVGVSWGGLFKYPLHASCKIEWTFGLNCKDTAGKIVGQMKTWAGDDCGTGEKCKYKLVSNDGTTLTATHTTPKKNYVDDLKFVFTSKGQQCQVTGTSSSETWYAVLDYSTNYCNLHNLITGSGLDKVSGYKESTSDSVCTQYTSANCEKY